MTNSLSSTPNISSQVPDFLRGNGMRWAGIAVGVGLVTLAVSLVLIEYWRGQRFWAEEARKAQEDRERKGKKEEKNSK